MCKATCGIYAFIQHVEASYNHVFQTCVALKGCYMEMTNGIIWIRPSATLCSLQGLFPIYVTGMSHFSGTPYTVVEIMEFDWASCIHHLCEANCVSNARETQELTRAWRKTKRRPRTAHMLSFTLLLKKKQHKSTQTALKQH